MFMPPLILAGKVMSAAQTTDVTTSVSCTNWAQLNSVSVTQTTPDGTSLYHAVSFDGGSTYKAFQSGSWSTVTTSNTTWTKAQIEAMTLANWTAGGGWSPSVSSIVWATRSISSTSVVADGSTNTSTTQAATGGTAICSSYYNASTVPANAFDGNSGTAWESNGSLPAWVGYQFSSGKVINKYRVNVGNYCASAIVGSWTIGGSNNGSSWTQLHSVGNGNNPRTCNAWETYSFSNSTSYSHYRLYCTYAKGTGTAYCALPELVLIEAQTTTTNPTFTKVTINYNTWT